MIVTIFFKTKVIALCEIKPQNQNNSTVSQVVIVWKFYHIYIIIQHDVVIFILVKIHL